MEIIILGLLMIKKSTVYEMKKNIENTFTAMSSNSLGSIQATIKKLLEKSLIIYSEYVENSVNKKVYELTECGKKYFFDNLSKPMLYKEKNMELAKFFFMGFAPKEKWNDLINAYISELKTEKTKLEQIRYNMPNNETVIKNNMDFLRENDTLANFQEELNSELAEDNIQNVAIFQIASLELSLAKLDFEIKWFENFKKTL